MASKHEAETLLRAGYSPAQIAEEKKISVNSVVQYLKTRVGEGALKVSDLLFAIPQETRAAFSAAVRQKEGKKAVDYSVLQPGTFCKVELDLYLQLSEPAILAGDLYELLAEIEVQLHSLIRRQLIAKYGESNWWRELSLPIRKDCASRREEDDDPADDIFSYTTFINLKVIVEDEWAIFCGVFPEGCTKNKKEFLKGFTKLNTVRNGVMHPVKLRAWNESDFEFVRNFRRAVLNCRGT